MSLRPAAGEGRTRLTDQVALRLAVLGGLARWMQRATGPDGALRCRRHGVEHTGKNVYAALLHLELWRYTREEECLDLCRRVVLRTVDMLGEDPQSKVPVFLPGRVDPRNASTNAIDGGACADTLATVLEECPEIFSLEESERITAALVSHVDGYLRHAAKERPITAQRLWAATGTARAARLLGRADWRADALAGCALALDELTDDGVSPYIPEGSEHCTHEGLAEISGFYHSRTPGFVLYVHDVLGEALDERRRERLGASLDALIAMRDGNGRKPIHNEAKAWYWESAYEVASHPFDAYALHTGARLLARPLYSNEAGAVMEEWIAHLSRLDGGVDSHHGPGVNFQCRVFWTAHAAWAARVLADVPLRRSPRDPVDVDLASSGLLHVERPRYTAILRGARRRSSNLFGCDVGGGALQSLVVRGDPRAQGDEQVAPQRFTRRRQGSVLVRDRNLPGRLPRLLRLARSWRGELRFRLFVASVEWGAKRWLPALCYPWRQGLLRLWRAASPWCAAHEDVGTVHVYDGEQVIFNGGVADAEGLRVPGVVTERRYRLQQDGVQLFDELRAQGLTGRVVYILPRRLTDVAVTAEGATALRRGDEVVLKLRGGTAMLRVEGFWPA